MGFLLYRQGQHRATGFCLRNPIQTHLWLKAHVKHAVSLVHDQVRHPPQVCHSADQQVDQAARCGRNHLRTRGGTMSA